VKDLKDLGLLALLAAWYFAAAYFTTAALLPKLAIHAAFWGAGLALLVYLGLFFARRDRPGKALAVLIFLPLSCVLIGVIWWVMRLLGIWSTIR
jgi:FtsH-binding integral membrane protein